MSSSDEDVAAVNRNRQLFRNASSSPPPPPAAAARRPAPRFLGDEAGVASDDDLFGDLDDVANAPLPKRLDPNPFDNIGMDVDDAFNVDKVNDGVDVDGVAQKKKRVMAKMDETRLLGPSGFPKLQGDIKRFKVGGKGSEAKDLKRLMTMYQLWAHQMYPKTNLRDTLQTVEKLCHKRSVQRALKEYRDEAKQAAAKAARLAAGDDSDNDARSPAARPERTPSPQRHVPPPAKAPPPQEDDFDGFDDLYGDDDEAMMAELEAAATKEKAPVAKVPKQHEEPAREQEEEGFDEDEEAEAMLREMEGEETMSRVDDLHDFDDLHGNDDEAMLAELEAAATKEKAPVAKVPTQPEEQAREQEFDEFEFEESEAMLQDVSKKEAHLPRMEEMEATS